MKINNIDINNNGRVFIIAEAGVNHNGDIEIAKRLVDEAVKCKVDAVKFQTFKSEKLVTQNASMANYQKDNIGVEQSQLDMIKKLEVGFEDFITLKKYCEEKGILFLSTPFDFDSAEFLNSIGMPAFKISSADLTNIPLLEKVAKYGKPMILSSGMSGLSEIEEALSAIKKVNDIEVAVLHCTSNYPASIENVNLRAVHTIVNAFNVPSGYSDHTEGITIPIAAAALGSAIIEKHFTLDKSMEGPDHKASLNPYELKNMVDEIRTVEKALGNGIKKCTESEINTKQVATKSIVAARKIKKGEILKSKDLEFKRPGTGVSPKYYKEIINKEAIVDVDKDEMIDFSMIR